MCRYIRDEPYVSSPQSGSKVSISAKLPFTQVFDASIKNKRHEKYTSMHDNTARERQAALRNPDQYYPIVYATPAYHTARSYLTQPCTCCCRDRLNGVRLTDRPKYAPRSHCRYLPVNPSGRRRPLCSLAEKIAFTAQTLRTF
ncbi:hypothetical protein Bbelb_177000 [Branchiostoma belcheri]|nr:hypothetical protein Bbelb_177000 [Branchiostoma belcheri]